MEESAPARLIKVMEGSCDKNETSVVLSSLLPYMDDVLQSLYSDVLL